MRDDPWPDCTCAKPGCRRVVFPGPREVDRGLPILCSDHRAERVLLILEQRRWEFTLKDAA